MIELIKIKEVHLGFIIFIVAFLSLLLSGTNINMSLSYGLIIIVLSLILNIFMIQVAILLFVPKKNKLKKMQDNNFYNKTFNIIFLFIYFAITTLIIALIADTLDNDRAYNILLISMFMTSLYNLLVSTMFCINYIRLSQDKYEES